MKFKIPTPGDGSPRTPLETARKVLIEARAPDPPLLFPEISDVFDATTVDTLVATAESLAAHRRQLIDELAAKGVTRVKDGKPSPWIWNVDRCEECSYVTLGVYGAKGAPIKVKKCDYCGGKKWRTIREAART